jgi:hypothetical protein
MSYLEIIERLKHLPKTTQDIRSARQPGNEINEKNELSPPDAPTLADGGVARCGSPTCAGCYSVGEIDGRERFIHPPKASPEWLEWSAKWNLAKWQPPEGSRTQ